MDKKEFKAMLACLLAVPWPWALGALFAAPAAAAFYASCREMEIMRKGIQHEEKELMRARARLSWVEQAGHEPERIMKKGFLADGILKAKDRGPAAPEPGPEKHYKFIGVIKSGGPTVILQDGLSGEFLYMKEGDINKDGVKLLAVQNGRAVIERAGGGREVVE